MDMEVGQGGGGGESGRHDNAQNYGDESSSCEEVFIRSFIFQPDLPIRIDYESKGFKTEMVWGSLGEELCTLGEGPWLGYNLL